jgi:threonine dehydratase
LQRTGSFKIRGAYNKIRSLPRETRGVVCASAGNHAQGVALAAQIAALPAIVVMPEDAPLTKAERTRGYGAEVLLSGTTLEAARERAVEIARERGYVFVHPFDDAEVIAGQATLGLELLEQLPEMTMVVVPVGGGGLISGVALAIKESRPGVRVVGVQAEGAAAAFRSYHGQGQVAVAEPATLADGIRVGRVSDLTLELMHRYVDDILTVSDEEIAAAMVQTLERSKLVVEGAGAAGLAALASGRLAASGQVCAVLSGGNIDLNLIARVIERGLTRAGRYTVLRFRISDRPGQLYQALATLARLKANVLEIAHRRAGFEVPVGFVEVVLRIETRDNAHGDQILEALRGAGFPAERYAAR